MRQVIVNYNLFAGQIKKELDDQFDSGRIKGTEYADVFNKLMSQAMQYAFESPLKEEQVKQAIEQTLLIDAQKEDQEYVTQHIRPLEKQKLVCETELCYAQVDLTKAQTMDQQYVTQNIRPLEMQIKTEELAIAREKVNIAQIETQIKMEELEIRRIEIDIARQKLELARQDAALKAVQVRLTERQIQGFDDNLKQKLFDAQMNAWAMMFSSGLLETVPSIINGDAVSSLYGCMNPC